MNRNALREVTVKIRLERIETQKGITMEVLLYSRTTGLVMSLKFVKEVGVKLKKNERPIYVRNIDRMFDKKGSIEHIV